MARDDGRRHSPTAYDPHARPGQTPIGKRRRAGVDEGCGQPACGTCYEDTPPTDQRARVAAMLDRPSFLDRFQHTSRLQAEPYQAPMYASDRTLVPYRLPNGTIVQVDDSAAKGARVIDFTLQGGAIVEATRVSAPCACGYTGNRAQDEHCPCCGADPTGSPAERQRAHLDTFLPERHTLRAHRAPTRAVLDQVYDEARQTGHPGELATRVLLVTLEALIDAYTLPVILEVLADALTIKAAAHDADHRATGPYAALAVLIEQARERAATLQE